ncbi:hypothetical protein ABKT66_21235 [Enterobacter cloacae]
MRFIAHVDNLDLRVSLAHLLFHADVFHQRQAFAAQVGQRVNVVT